MKISEQDYKEVEIINHLIEKLELIDAQYVNTESDIMFQQQPFVISLLLGYNYDLKPTELEEI